jgi:transposase
VAAPNDDNVAREERALAAASASDREYGCQRIRQWCRRRRIKAMIPTRSNQPRDEDFDKGTCRQRHIIELVVGWYKEYRALGTCHEKLAVNCMAS